MYKVGDKVAIKASNVDFFDRTGDGICEIGEIFTITDINIGICISNERGTTYVYEDEIESLRKIKLEKILKNTNL